MTTPTADAPTADASQTEPLPESSRFLRRLLIITLSLLLLILTFYLLEKFRSILQPLFVGLFMTYLSRPIRVWLVRHGMKPLLAHATLLLLLLLMLGGVGALGYSNYRDVTDRLPIYELRLEGPARCAPAHSAMKRESRFRSGSKPPTSIWMRAPWIDAFLWWTTAS